MTTFHEWADNRLIDDSIRNALDQKPKQHPSLAADHYYDIKIPAKGDWQKVKQLIQRRLQLFINDQDFTMYPSDVRLQYQGIEGGHMIFRLRGNLRREINDEPGWLPPKGVYAPNKVVQTRLTFSN